MSWHPKRARSIWRKDSRPLGSFLPGVLFLAKFAKDHKVGWVGVAGFVPASSLGFTQKHKRHGSLRLHKISARAFSSHFILAVFFLVENLRGKRCSAFN